MSPNKRSPVWSSEEGDLRHQPARSAPAPTAAAPRQQTVYLHRDSKGRGGKTVTLVKNLRLREEALKALAAQLKQACGGGGTIKDGIIEIQGEHREKIAALLRQQGYQVKLAGG